MGKVKQMDWVVLSNLVSREVAANELIIRNERDMYEFGVSNLTTIVEGERKMLTSPFIWLTRYVPTTQNDQIHSNNSSTVADELFE